MIHDIALHWSFDHGSHHAAGFDFAEELRTALHQGLAGDTLDYLILPNYWSGYAGHALKKVERLAFGKLQIRKQAENGIYIYQVSHRNEASGEELEATYQALDDPFRSLTGAWRMDARNHAGDQYRQLSVAGNLQDEGYELTINNRIRLSQQTVQQLTCNWSLFECLHELGESEINLLVDLEKPSPGCRLTWLDMHEIELAGQTIELTGYSLQGRGMPPSYWWLAADGRVAIMSNVFCTYVLGDHDV